MSHVSLYPFIKWLVLKKIFGYLARDVNAADQDNSYQPPVKRRVNCSVKNVKGRPMAALNK